MDIITVYITTSDIIIIIISQRRHHGDDYDAQTTCKMFAPSAHIIICCIIILCYTHWVADHIGEQTILRALYRYNVCYKNRRRYLHIFLRYSTPVKRRYKYVRYNILLLNSCDDKNALKKTRAWMDFNYYFSLDNRKKSYGTLLVDNGLISLQSLYNNTDIQYIMRCLIVL